MLENTFVFVGGEKQAQNLALDSYRKSEMVATNGVVCTCTI